LNLLEESAQLQVLLDFMDKLHALIVMLFAKKVELLRGPVVEELEELDVLGKYLQVLRGVEAPDYIGSYEAIGDYPDAVNVPQVVLLHVNDPSRLHVMLVPLIMLTLPVFSILNDEIILC